MTALDLAQLPVWLGSVLLAMGRVTGLCLLAPVFSSNVVSARVRVGLIVVLTLVLAPLVHGSVDP
jgi:flagellar biosynthetic protein FliR